MTIIADRSYSWPSTCNTSNGSPSVYREASQKSSTRESQPRKSASVSHRDAWNQMWGGHSFPPRTSSTGFHLRPGELVFVQFHVHLAAPEGDAFRLQPESLFEGIISAQLDGASGSQHSLPGQGDRASQSCYYLAGGARKSGSSCDS